jgi:hypothetical protein
MRSLVAIRKPRQARSSPYGSGFSACGTVTYLPGLNVTHVPARTAAGAQGEIRVSDQSLTNLYVRGGEAGVHDWHLG